MAYWLMKSEPTTYSFDDLCHQPKKTDFWDGVRNYQARNFMKAMSIGDEAFFYHSNCKEPGIVGSVKIVKAAYPDDTSWDPDSPYFDPKSTPENPRWFRVDVQAIAPFTHPILLSDLKAHPGLDGLPLIQKGSRLSVMPVSEAHWKSIMAMQVTS